MENAINEDKNKSEELRKASTDENKQLSASQVSAKQLADAKKVAEEELKTAEENDAKKASEISALTTKKNQEEASKPLTKSVG